MAALEQSDLDNELCPNCGDFVSPSEWDDATGFCKTCTGGSSSGNQLESFLAKHADHIEHYLLQGCSLNQAIDSLRVENHRYRTCSSCGGFIERAGPKAIFCRKKVECRRAARRYTYLYEQKGYSKAQALAQVLTAINGSE